MTQPVRVPDAVYESAKHLAALRGESSGDLLAKAWAEFLENHREEFARDLEHVAKLLRDGTTSDLSMFVKRNNATRARAAAARIQPDENH